MLMLPLAENHSDQLLPGPPVSVSFSPSSNTVVPSSRKYSSFSLHQLGPDQHRLTYPHLGRDERLTFVERKVMQEIV